MYYNPETKQKMDRSDLKKELNASFPYDAEEVEGWFLIHPGSISENVQVGQSVVPGSIEFINGKYVQTYEVFGNPFYDENQDKNETDSRISALEDGLAEIAQLLSEII